MRPPAYEAESSLGGPTFPAVAPDVSAELHLNGFPAAALFDDGDGEPVPEAYDEEEEEVVPYLPNTATIAVDDDYFDEEEEPLFSPPLYIQRYCAVEQIIESTAQSVRLDSLIDLGCAELKFLVRAKNGKIFKRVVGVDCDEFLVGSHCRRIQPGVFEMINKRDQTLKMEVYAGDATLPDQRLLDIDVVTAIELIEHMEPETHADLAAAIFDVMQPKLAIFTTPNVEYNPLFPGGSIEVRRHWDHRFEWTRAEFQAWATGVTEKYPAYSVTFEGVGYGPEGTHTSHGCCSQIAVFTRDPCQPRSKRHVVAQPYKLMREIDYPWAPPKTVDEEIYCILDGECYSLAKELQEAEELAGHYNREWFTFTVDQLYATRWRLQNLLNSPDNLETIRGALRVLRKDWVKFDEENDKVSYQLQPPPDESPEDSFMDGPSLDVESEAAGTSGYYSLENEFWLEELEDPVDFTS